MIELLSIEMRDCAKPISSEKIFHWFSLIFVSNFKIFRYPKLKEPPVCTRETYGTCFRETFVPWEHEHGLSGRCQSRTYWQAGAPVAVWDWGGGQTFQGAHLLMSKNVWKKKICIITTLTSYMEAPRNIFQRGVLTINGRAYIDVGSRAWAPGSRSGFLGIKLQSDKHI